MFSVWVSRFGAEFFRDHAWLTPRDWADRTGAPQKADAIILTEKDAIKPGASEFPLLAGRSVNNITDAGGFLSVS